ncbi:hypothetical protein HGH92_26745 [Chitinophaga varians]|uniref:Uncharacterized protein n=1 Tax=Chitinophaga varians TaxID=2202339 RepID=A0A847RXZ3_9BACT|nr:hypothetical protein [Chitinophaga varians]NLR67932.1 hypothetical protein [Chitinophaga varians]
MHSPLNTADTYGFDISYLLVSQNGIPATSFKAGVPLTISWESTGTYFRLFAGGQSQAVYEGTQTTATLSNITVDTTFTLEASVPGSGKLYKSVTIYISNPTLTPNSIKVTTVHTVNKDLTANNNAAFNQLNVNGQLVFPDSHDPSLQINGYLNTGCAITVLKDTNIQGTATINDLTINSNIRVNGNFNNKNGTQVTHLDAAGLNAANTTTQKLEIAQSLNAVDGSVSMLTTGNTVYQGGENTTKKITAKTDGYLLVYLPTSPPGYAIMTLDIYGYKFQLMGNFVLSDTTIPNSNTLFLPISNGTPFTFTIHHYLYKPIFTINWYPIGTAASVADTYEIIDIPTDTTKTPQFDIAALQATRLETATAFLENIERTCDKTIDAPIKQILVEKLLALTWAPTPVL